MVLSMLPYTYICLFRHTPAVLNSPVSNCFLPCALKVAILLLSVTWRMQTSNHQNLPLTKSMWQSILFNTRCSPPGMVPYQSGGIPERVKSVGKIPKLFKRCKEFSWPTTARSRQRIHDCWATALWAFKNIQIWWDEYFQFIYSRSLVHVFTISTKPPLPRGFVTQR